MTIRKIEIASLIMTLCLALVVAAEAQKPPAFLLKADIKGIPDGKEVYLILGRDTVGKGQSQGGRFEIVGSVDGATNYYFLRLDSNKTSNALWLENKKMNLSGDAKQLKALKLTGSTSHEDYLKATAIEATMKDGEDAKKLREFVANNTESLFVPYLLKNMQADYGFDEYINVFRSLSAEVRASHYGVQLAREIAIREKFGTFFKSGAIGSTLPNFEVHSADGKVKRIHDLITGSRYTLIDFWASWCAPCRDAIPAIEKVYNEYHSRGFNVLSVSIDKSETAWRKAMKEDGVPWGHSIDDIDIAYKSVFNMAAIPGYILVDSNRIILRADYISKENMRNVSTKGMNVKDSLYSIIGGLVK